MSVDLYKEDLMLTQTDSGDTASDVFRPIHYLGSKLRVLEQIERLTAEICGTGPVCDLFSGSGTVSHYLAKKRDVVCNDVQEYSKTINSGLLCSRLDEHDIQTLLSITERAKNSEVFNELSDAMSGLISYEKDSINAAENGSPEALCELIEFGSIAAYYPSMNERLNKLLYNAKINISMSPNANKYNLLTTYFGGVYFSFCQTVAFDAIKSIIDSLPVPLRDVANTAALNSLSELVNTVGKQFAQPLRPRDKNGIPKKNLAHSVRRDRDKDVFACFNTSIRAVLNNNRFRVGNVSLKSDFSDLPLNYRGDLSGIYADPPYTRDHYSRFYHVLETYCLYDYPEISVVKKNGVLTPSRGVYRASRHQSPFCIRSQASDAFRSIFLLGKKYECPILISYSPFENATSHPRVMSLDDIVELGREFYKTVSIESAGKLRHSKLNKSSLHLPASEQAEVFIVAE